ncbi:MAG TPA: DivIVA domain-containing protein [Coriobacteriia bacterium]
MKLTPLDIHHKEFRNSLRGYSPEEVDDFLDEVAEEFERLFKENIDLSEKLEEASARVRAYADMERTLQNTMVAAQTSADDIRSRADAEAARLVADAESKSQEIVSAALGEKQRSLGEHARLKASEEEFRARFRTMLEDYLATISAPGSDERTSFVASAPVSEPVEVAPIEPVAEVEVAVPATDPEPIGSVVSLTLGEMADSELDEPEVPSLDVPDDFTLPHHRPMGERDDDHDIEEID